MEVFSDCSSNLHAKGSCHLGNRKQMLSVLSCFTVVKVVSEYLCNHESSCGEVS